MVMVTETPQQPPQWVQDLCQNYDHLKQMQEKAVALEGQVDQVEAIKADMRQAVEEARRQLPGELQVPPSSLTEEFWDSLQKNPSVDVDTIKEKLDGIDTFWEYADSITPVSSPE